MAKQSRTAIKAYFQTDDVPTEAQYIDTWDSFINKTTDLATSTAIQKANGSGELADAVAGTDYLAPNTPIAPATKTKITYDADGLVTSGADATTADIADSSDKRYVTDAQLTVIGNTSGTNTGDNAANTSIAATKLDDFTAPDDNTDLNATTSAHGLVVKATAPAAGLYNYVGITNGETAYTNKALFDTTDPSTQAFGDSAATGSATVAARRDHKHAMPSAPTVEGTAVLSTGETGGTKFLREDGDGTCSWNTIPGGGDVLKVGTPVDNQVGVWTGDGTIEGDTALTFDTSTDTLTTGVLVTTGNIELGHATDTTISRVSAGVAAVEGKNIALNGTSETLTTGTIELGAASDTTISRVSAGKIAVEGVNVLTTAGDTLTGNLTFGENTALILDPALSADGKYCGIVRAGTAGAALAFGDLCYLAAADSRWELADADAASTSGDVILGMCVLAATGDGDPTTMLLIGTIRADAAFPALTVGAQAYVSTTAGDIQTAQPTGTDDVIRVVGWALTADELYFNPSNDYITHT